MNYRMLAIVAVLAVGSSVSAAFAGDTLSIEASDPETERALALHRAGNTYYNNKDYARACAAYTAAYALKQNYQIAGSLGDCELQLGRYRDGAEHIDTFIREYPPDRPPERLEQAKALLAQVRAHVVALRIDVPMSGADVLVDGRSIGKAPIAGDVYVAAGTHRIEAMLGLAFAGQTIDARAGELRTVVLVPSRKPVEKPSHAGRSNAKAVWMGVAVGVAVVGTGVGVASLLLASSRNTEREQILTRLSTLSGKPKDAVCGAETPFGKDCNRVNVLVDEKNIPRNVAIGAFMLGVTGLATSIGLGLSSEKSTTAPKVRASAFVTPMSGGISVVGHF